MAARSPPALDPKLAASSIAEAFRRHFTGGVDSALDEGELEACLGRLTAEAKARWPKVEVHLEAWARHLAERVDRGAVLKSLEALDGPGSLVACACLTGDPGGLEAFDAELSGAPLAALRRLRLDDSAIDEFLQLLRERLLLGGDGPPRLARYSGRGRLSGWLRTSAVRLASDRMSQRQPASDSDDPLLAMAAGPTPELAAIRRDLREHVKAAFNGALAGLTRRQRALLRLSMVEGLGIDRMAPIYGTSRATIARWISQAKDELASRTRRELCARLQLRAPELDDLMASVKSHIDLSLERALAEDGRR